MTNRNYIGTYTPQQRAGPNSLSGRNYYTPQQGVRPTTLTVRDYEAFLDEPFRVRPSHDDGGFRDGEYASYRDYSFRW